MVISMKTINILGVTLKDYTLKEAIRMTERYLHNGALNTIICASAKQFILAAEDAHVKQWFESVDLALYADADILQEAEGTGRSHIGEAEYQEYMELLLERLAKSGNSLYLLAETEEKLSSLEKELTGCEDNLSIVGSSSIEKAMQSEEQADALINEMNGLAPKVIIAKLPFETSMIFLEHNQMKMNAEVFLSLTAENSLQKKETGIHKLKQHIDRTILKRRVIHFINKEKEE